MRELGGADESVYLEAVGHVEAEGAGLYRALLVARWCCLTDHRLVLDVLQHLRQLQVGGALVVLLAVDLQSSRQEYIMTKCGHDDVCTRTEIRSKSVIQVQR